MARLLRDLLVLAGSITAAALGSLAQAQTAQSTIPREDIVLGIVVNQTTNKIYLSGVVTTVIDGASDTAVDIGNSASFSGLAVNPVTNTIYAASGIFSGLPSVPNLTVIDGATNAVKLTIPGTAGPMAVNTVTNKIYVANGNNGNVTVVDGATNATLSVAVGQVPSAIALNSVTNKVYVCAYDHVTVIDGATNATTMIPVGYAGGIAVNSVTNKIYVTNTDADNVNVIDGATNTASSIKVGTNAGGVAVNPVTNKIYVDVNSINSVAVIDGVTQAVTDVVLVGQSLSQIAVNPTTNKVYVEVFNGGSVAVIDGATDALTAIPVPPKPSAVAVNPLTGKVYVGLYDYVNQFGAVAILSGPGAGAPAQALTVNPGAAVAFDAQVGGNPLPVYQWSRNGAPVSDGGGISGATTGTLYLSGAAARAGTYSWTATNALGNASGSGSPLTIGSTPTPVRLVNLSARASVGTGSNVLITGYVVLGSAPLALLQRVSGPALAPLQVPGVLADPQLRLYSNGAMINSNAGWGGDPLIAAASSAVGAFAWSDAASRDSALLAAQNPGAYSAITSSMSGGTGVVLAELYDATSSATWNSSLPRLGNISARASVGTGGNVLIAGFVIAGSAAKTVLIRASGPALASLNLTGVLSDPRIQLFRGVTSIATNAGRNGNAAIAAAANAVGAFAWSDPTSRDAALLLTLPPGSYTAIVSGISGDTGLALAEVYDVP